jgi:hypothetical protein
MIDFADPITAPTPVRPLGWLRHSLVLAGRSLAKTRRNPGAVINAVVTPALFGAVFLYLFGGSVAGSTTDYVQYLFPGILAMGAGVAGMLSTGTNINLDLKNGITDRFRSLPISRLAPLLGSMLADLIRYLGTVVILFGLGTLAGFRVRGGPPRGRRGGRPGDLVRLLSQLADGVPRRVDQGSERRGHDRLRDLSAAAARHQPGRAGGHPSRLAAGVGRRQPGQSGDGRLPRPAQRLPGRRRDPRHPDLVRGAVRGVLPLGRAGVRAPAVTPAVDADPDLV